MLDGVHEVLRISEPYKLASRTFKPEGTIVTVGDVRIGGDEVIVMAGPCSAENEQQVRAAAAAVRARRREDFPRRRVQAAQLAVQLPGTRRGRAASAARRVERREPEADHRGDGRQPDRGDRQVHRHLPGRRAQHAELHAAARARARAQAGAAQARHFGDDRGMAAVGGVRAQRRQQRRRSCASAASAPSRPRPATPSTSRRFRWSRS